MYKQERWQEEIQSISHLYLTFDLASKVHDVIPAVQATESYQQRSQVDRGEAEHSIAAHVLSTSSLVPHLKDQMLSKKMTFIETHIHNAKPIILTSVHLDHEVFNPLFSSC